MSVFEDEVLQQVVAIARMHEIEPAALLAVVEVESAGKSLEADGKTPCLLFERHIFNRELQKAKKDQAHKIAHATGLANDAWDPTTQYKDERTSKQRLALFQQARAIDEECAIRSCSWGVGQTMGFLAEEMHFPNAVTMFNYMVKGGIPAQVECMVKEIENHKLTSKLNNHNWAAFAKVYNGPGFTKNHYDTKMAEAYDKWKKADLTKVATPKPVIVPPDLKPAPTPPPPPITTTEAGTGTGIVAFFAGLWAALKNLEPITVAFGVFILALVVATIVILWRRHKDSQIPQLGVLTNVEGAAS